MQKTLLLILVICVISQNTTAQDWHKKYLPEGAKARLGKGGITGNITFSPDGKYLAVACSTGIWLYDAHTDAPLQLLTGHTDIVLKAVFSPDGILLASGSNDKTVRLWDARTGTELRTMKGDNRAVEGIAFSPDGTLLASGAHDSTVSLWDVQTGALIIELKAHTRYVNSIAFSPDGSMLASGSADGTVLLWNLASNDDVD